MWKVELDESQLKFSRINRDELKDEYSVNETKIFELNKKLLKPFKDYHWIKIEHKFFAFERDLNGYEIDAKEKVIYEVAY